MSAGTKGLMRVTTAVEVAANAAIKWREQYKDWDADDRFADGDTKGDVNDRLNSERHTPENIASILNEEWAYPKCSCCGESRNALVIMCDGWSDFVAAVCLPCAERAVALLRNIPGAADPIVQGQTP